MFAAVTIVTAVLAFLVVNHLAHLYLGRYTSNRGYWIVHQKWELLDDTDEAVDWLILGDSTCNQGVYPKEWDRLTKGRSLNLCTIGNMVTVDDAWMLQSYIDKHGPPENVLVMHAYDMWHRDLNPALLAQIPLGFGFWKQFEPEIELGTNDLQTLLASRYFPLYSQNSSLKDAARTGLEQMSWKAPFRRDFEMDEQGFMPWRTAYPGGVRRDAAGHLNFLNRNEYAMSDVSRRGLAGLVRIAEKNGVEVHIVPAPVVEQLARSSAFERYQAALSRDLAEVASRSNAVNFYPRLHTFAPHEMENADHVVLGAAMELTRAIAADVADVDPASMAVNVEIAPSRKPDVRIGAVEGWGLGPGDGETIVQDTQVAFVEGLGVQVPVRLESRPRDRVAIVSRWSTADNRRSFELGVNELQQPYLAISPDGEWNGQTMTLISEAQLRIGEDALVSASFVPGKSASIWINGQRVANRRRGVPKGVFFSEHPIIFGNRTTEGSNFAIDAALGPAIVKGEPLPHVEVTKRTSDLGLPTGVREMAELVQVTNRPGNHWFGYYDKHQFSPNQRFLLVMKTPFENREPRKNDVIEIGMIDLENDYEWISIGESRAWSWQQGCMLQWRPKSDSEVLWNDREGDRFVTRIHNIETGKTRTIPHPIYHVSPNGDVAVDADFARIQHMRHGYGYPGVADPNGDELLPTNRPINLIDLETGEATPIVDYPDFVEIEGPRLKPKPGSKHYVNHLQFSPDGERIMFLHRWHPPTGGGFGTRIFTVKTDGTELQLLTDDRGLSHYTWRDPRTLLIWTGQHGGYTLYDVEDGFSGVVLSLKNGHQSYVPGTNNRWLVTDTYPDDDGKQALILYDIERDELFIIARLPVARKTGGEFRTDLHPRVSRDGSMVAIDSSHSGGRQQYLVDIRSWIETGPSETEDD